MTTITTTTTTQPLTLTPTWVLAQGSHTSLAEELNAAMAANWGARHLYLVTYGVAWSPLPLNGYDAAPALTAGRADRAELPTVR